MFSTTVQSAKKALIAAVAALGIGAALVGPASPASAQTLHGGGHGGGGWHAGGGGWHGGSSAWRGGGNWRGGATAWRGGWRNRGYGYGWGPGVGFGVAGLAAGAVFEGPYGDGCLTYQAVYDAYGRYAGQREVYIC